MKTERSRQTRTRAGVSGQPYRRSVFSYAIEDRGGPRGDGCAAVPAFVCRTTSSVRRVTGASEGVVTALLCVSSRKARVQWQTAQ